MEGPWQRGQGKCVLGRSCSQQDLTVGQTPGGCTSGVWAHGKDLVAQRGPGHRTGLACGRRSRGQGSPCRGPFQDSGLSCLCPGLPFSVLRGILSGEPSAVTQFPPSPLAFAFFELRCFPPIPAAGKQSRVSGKERPVTHGLPLAAGSEALQPGLPGLQLSRGYG